MRIFIVLLLMYFAAPGICEESSSGTWTYSTGLKIVSVTKLKDHPGKLTWRIEPKGKDYIVIIKDYFFRDGDFQETYLADTREGKATLTVKSKEQKLFKTRDEYPLQLTIKIDGKRLHKGQTVYFYNGDYGEVAGHQVIK
jgi:hypothetical protein